jgi:hypothetical protein
MGPNALFSIERPANRVRLADFSDFIAEAMAQLLI